MCVCVCVCVCVYVSDRNRERLLEHVRRVARQAFVCAQQHGLDIALQFSLFRAERTGMIFLISSLAAVWSTNLEIRCSPATANTGAAHDCVEVHGKTFEACKLPKPWRLALRSLCSRQRGSKYKKARHVRLDHAATWRRPRACLLGRESRLAYLRRYSRICRRQPVKKSARTAARQVHKIPPGVCRYASVGKRKTGIACRYAHRERARMRFAYDVTYMHTPSPLTHIPTCPCQRL